MEASFLEAVLVGSGLGDRAIGLFLRFFFDARAFCGFIDFRFGFSLLYAEFVEPVHPAQRGIPHFFGKRPQLHGCLFRYPRHFFEQRLGSRFPDGRFIDKLNFYGKPQQNAVNQYHQACHERAAKHPVDKTEINCLQPFFESVGGGAQHEHDERDIDEEGRDKNRWVLRIEHPLQDIRRRRRDFEGQNDAENVGQHVENGTDNAPRIALPEAEAERDDEYQINGHDIKACWL